MSNKLSTSTAKNVAAACIPKISLVLRKLLQDFKIKPSELSATLDIPNQTIYQLLNQKEIYPKISTLMPIARFFKVTIGQLVGDEPLGTDSTAEDEAIDSPGIWNQDLYLQCAKHAIQLLAKYKITPNNKLAMKLISDIYYYSLRGKKSTVDEMFADWCVSQYARR